MHALGQQVEAADVSEDSFAFGGHRGAGVGHLGGGTATTGVMLVVVRSLVVMVCLLGIVMHMIMCTRANCWPTTTVPGWAGEST